MEGSLTTALMGLTSRWESIGVAEGQVAKAKANLKTTKEQHKKWLEDVSKYWADRRFSFTKPITSIGIERGDPPAPRVWWEKVEQALPDSQLAVICIEEPHADLGCPEGSYVVIVKTLNHKAVAFLLNQDFIDSIEIIEEGLQASA